MGSVQPQIDFVLEEWSDQRGDSDDRRAQVTSLLSYVGRVENLADDWSALVERVFGLDAAKKVHTSLQDPSNHERNREDEAYMGGVDPKFNAHVESASAQARIKRAYQVDADCYGV